MNNRSQIERALWPPDSLSDCLPALLHRAGLTNSPDPGLPAPDPSALDSWMHRAAQKLSCEAAPLTATYRELESDLSGVYPAILKVGDNYLAVIRERKGRMRLLCPDSRLIDVPAAVVCDELREPLTGKRRAEMEDLLGRCGVPGKSRTRAAGVLACDHLGQRPLRNAWFFTGSCGAPANRWLGQAGAIRNAFLLLFSHSAAYALWLLAWAILGASSLNGHMDQGWLLGWSLLIATVVLWRVLATWFQGSVAIGVAGLLKARLLAGVLRLDPEEIRQHGIGSFLGQTFEAEAFETLALGGGIAGLLATVDLLLAACVLGRGAMLLALWFVLTLLVAWRYLLRYRQWTANRMKLTEDLVESMAGHRTRLAQQAPETWHAREDRALETYYEHSTKSGRLGCLLTAFIPRGWLLLGLAYLGKSVVAGQALTTQTAVLLGGLLLSWSAFERLAASLPAIVAAFVSWNRLAPIFRAAARPELLGSLTGRAPREEPGPRNAIEADRLTFRYRANSAPVLDNCGLVVRSGARILLEGPSGGGKTTLASLLTGARKPESGLLLSGGLDMQTLGREGWRKQAMLVPQFHENYILTGTLAFNLLCGRAWPPNASDMQRADEVCRGLGLGPLLDRMPNGLMQMVGEGGWQLSHGERSRVFIARALLQNPELMILDESFGALDPENLQTAIRFTIEQAKTLMVIAHP